MSGIIINPYRYAATGLPALDNTYSMYTDGVDEGVYCGNGVGNFGFGDPFSVSFWFTTTTQAAYDTFISNYLWQGNYPAGGGVGWTVYYNNQFIFTMEGSNWNKYSVIQTPFATGSWNANGPGVVGFWHHMVCTYNGGGLDNANMKMYIDTYDVTTPSSNLNTAPIGVLTSAAELVIGDIDWQAGAGTTTRSRNGNMDEVAIFDYELSQSDINLIYNGTPPSGGGAAPPAQWNDGTGVPADLSAMSTPPVAWYRMGD